MTNSPFSKENLLYLQAEKCKACTHCIRVCPTEAIRIRNGKATILNHRCIQCGQCIAACPRKAWEVRSKDLMEILNLGKARAVLDPSVGWQMGMGKNPFEVIDIFKKIGFFEVIELNEALTQYRWALEGYLYSSDIPKPVIGSACPSVIQLVQVKYPSLLENLLPISLPQKIVAMILENSSKESVSEGDLYYISPCFALAQAVRDPSFGHRQYRGAIPFRNIYNSLQIHGRSIRKESMISIPHPIDENWKWADPGKWIESIQIDRLVVVDGIRNVSEILDRVENGFLEEIQFIEAWACPGGCLGGSLLTENPYLARANLNHWRKAKQAYIKMEPRDSDFLSSFSERYRMNPRPFPRPGLRLDEDMARAIAKLREIDRVVKLLPGIDCGSCGCPTCLAFAEDVVQGYAQEGDCLYWQRLPKRMD
jgi:Fe-S-cluster-containing hydrogenase component 2